MKFAKWRRIDRVVICTLLALIGISIPLFVLALEIFGERTRNDYLDRVEEPIRIDFGLSLDDGGSLILQFTDKNGLERNVCLENSYESIESVWASGAHRTLILGAATPGHPDKRVPIAGEEEKRLLGILKRWTEYDEFARKIEADHQKYDGTANYTKVLLKYRDTDHPKFMAWCLFDRLRKPTRRPDSPFRKILTRIRSITS